MAVVLVMFMATVVVVTFLLSDQIVIVSGLLMLVQGIPSCADRSGFG
jgi:hypothetical protein